MIVFIIAIIITATSWTRVVQYVLAKHLVLRSFVQLYKADCTNMFNVFLMCLKSLTSKARVPADAFATHLRVVRWTLALQDC